MGIKSFRGLPKILKINEINPKKLSLSVLFSNGENRILDFNKILQEDWQVVPADPEYILLDPNQFKKVKVENSTLTWKNIGVSMTGEDGNTVSVPFDVGADVLYELSESDLKRTLSVGALIRKARLAANMTQDEVALLSGTSRTYITKLENDSQDIELMTLIKIVEGGLNKHLKISIE